MSKTVPMLHPAVVLRSHYQHLRSLLAVLLVALVGVSATVVVLAVDNGGSATIGSRNPTAQSATKLGDPLQMRTQSTRSTGGLDESKVAAAIGSQPEAGPLARWHQYQQAIGDMTSKQRAAAFGPGH